MESELIQITFTCGNKSEAATIANALIKQRLVACVQVTGPVESTFHWKNAVETETEWLCLAKSLLSRYAEAERVILELHSYENPEIIATPVIRASKGYAAWVDEELG